MLAKILPETASPLGALSTASVLALSIILTACGSSSNPPVASAPEPETPIDPPEPPPTPQVLPDIFGMVVPPGANGDSGSSGQGQNRPANFVDQLFMYEELAFAPEGLTVGPEGNECDLADSPDEHSNNDRSLACSHFKRAPLMIDPANANCTALTNPRTSNTVDVCTDAWGVPYVRGDTREDAMFGFGYAGALTRMWLFDVLRSIGRGRLAEFLGPFDDAFDFDRDIASVVGYNEDEITAVVEDTGGRWPFPTTDGQKAEAGIAPTDATHACDPNSVPAGANPGLNPNADPAYGKFGLLSKMVICDLDSMVAGMNAYVATVRPTTATHSDYALAADINNPANNPVPQCSSTSNCSDVASSRGFTRNDIVASAILIQATFAFGGGGEANSVDFLQAFNALDASADSDANDGLIDSQFSINSTAACELWRDLRHANDPTHPDTDPVNANATQSPATIPETCGGSWPTAHGVLPAGTAIWDAGSRRGRTFYEIADGLPFPPFGRADQELNPGSENEAQSETQLAALDIEEMDELPESPSDLFSMKPDLRQRIIEKITTLVREEPGSLSLRETQPRKMAANANNPHEAVHTSLAAAGFSVPRTMSNFIGVTGSQTQTGQPITVMGPQTGYFLPQLLWEVAIVSGVDASGNPLNGGPGPFDFAGRGVVFGQLPYINIGRGIDYAWSATSGNTDLVDTRVSLMCNIAGSALDTAGIGPSIDDVANNTDGSNGGDGFPDADGYFFDAEDGNGMVCRPFQIRTDTYTASDKGASIALNGQPSPPQNVTVRVMRTHYGPVTATATVQGQPAAISAQRSTFFAELDTAPPFALITNYLVGEASRAANGGTVGGDPQVQDFFNLFNSVTGTFNWLYIQKDNLAWFHSGLFPDRAEANGVSVHHPELPVWGDGRFDWQGADVTAANTDLNEFFDLNDGIRNYYRNPATPLIRDTLTSTRAFPGAEIPWFFEYAGFRQTADHPQANNPELGYLQQWNQNPAEGWWAPDSNGSYGPIHRANMLRDRLEAFQDSGRLHDMGTMVEIMSDAAHTDLRGMRVVPLALDVLRSVTQAQFDAVSGSFASLASFEELQEVIAFMDVWAGDGSMHWIVGEEEDGLGGYRRAPRDPDGSTRVAPRASDGNEEIAFAYEYRQQVVFMDAWYEAMDDRVIGQIRGMNNAGTPVFQGFYNAPGATGSAYQSGWFQFMERVLANALDRENGTELSQGAFYNRLICGAANVPTDIADFADCQNALLLSMDDALDRLEGFSQRATWTGERLSNRVVEQRDAIRHTAISAQNTPAMHWSNRPTYQGIHQIYHTRDEDGAEGFGLGE